MYVHHLLSIFHLNAFFFFFFFHISHRVILIFQTSNQTSLSLSLFSFAIDWIRREQRRKNKFFLPRKKDFDVIIILVLITKSSLIFLFSSLMNRYLMVWLKERIQLDYLHFFLLLSVFVHKMLMKFVHLIVNVILSFHRYQII